MRISLTIESDRHRVAAKASSSSSRWNTTKNTLCVELHAAQSTPPSAAFTAPLLFHRRRLVRIPHHANIGTTPLLAGSCASRQHASHSCFCLSASISKLSSMHHPRQLTLSLTPRNNSYATTTATIAHHFSFLVPATATVGRARRHRYAIAMVAGRNSPTPSTCSSRNVNADSPRSPAPRLETLFWCSRHAGVATGSWEPPTGDKQPTSSTTSYSLTPPQTKGFTSHQLFDRLSFQLTLGVMR